MRKEVRGLGQNTEPIREPRRIIKTRQPAVLQRCRRANCGAPAVLVTFDVKSNSLGEGKPQNTK
jgi:hypothetical protein